MVHKQYIGTYLHFYCMHLDLHKHSLFLQSVSQIKINKASCLFFSRFWPLLNQVSFLQATGVVLKIGSSLKQNHYREI